MRYTNPFLKFLLTQIRTLSEVYSYYKKSELHHQGWSHNAVL